jgi:hypothetical protein
MSTGGIADLLERCFSALPFWERDVDELGVHLPTAGISSQGRLEIPAPIPCRRSGNIELQVGKL